MELLASAAQVLFQLFVLVFTGAGWGAWIERVVRPAATSWSAIDWFLCRVAGFCACFLVLQNLVYAGCPLQWSAWLGPAVAAAGIAAHWRRRALFSRPGLAWPLLVVGASVFAFQAQALVIRGPANYYGNAHQDHVNYVQLAQFLVEKPIGLTISEVGHHPWLVKPIDLKEGRITQSVAHGYLAVVALADAKDTYGTISIFFVGVLASCVAALLLLLGSGRTLAILAGCWAGLLPAITKTHLDGFFSQTLALFVFPALGVAMIRMDQLGRRGWVVPAILLSFLLGDYTEVFAVGAAMWAALCATRIEWSWTKRLGRAALAIFISLLVLAAYLSYSLAFTLHQYQVASDPTLLSDLAPHAGTWRGWTEVFLGPVGTQAAVLRAKLLGGFLLLALCVGGLASRSITRRWFLFALIIVPLGLGALLLSAPVFSKYPFGKLLTLFSPLAVVLGTLGGARLIATAARFLAGTRRESRGLAGLGRPSLRRGLAAGGLVVFILAATQESERLQRVVIASGENLPILSSEKIRQTFAELERHPERTYFLKEPHVLLNAWLCYHARHSRLYVDVDQIGDRSVYDHRFAFRSPPPAGRPLLLLTGDAIKSYAQVDAAPELIVHNNQGMERDNAVTWYWIGDEVTFEAINFSSQPQIAELSFRALSGPAAAAPRRVVSLHSRRDGAVQTRDFENDARLAFTLNLAPGSNFFVLTVDDPKEGTRIAGDARKLMVRMQEINLRESRPLAQ